jgi:hypothetical protein
LLALPVPESRNSGVESTAYAAAVLHALAREEAAGRRPRRLLEAGRATWTRFRGRLGDADLLALLLEDAAVTQPEPFDVERVLGRPLDVPGDLVASWLGALDSLDLGARGPEYVAAQAKLLGVNSRMARADLHKVKAHQRVLELPGTGGQLAHHLLHTDPALRFADNFVVACGSWQERTLAGLVAVETGASGELPIRLDPELAGLRAEGAGFDFVIGSSKAAPESLSPDRLAIWFPRADILLV